MTDTRTTPVWNGRVAPEADLFPMLDDDAHASLVVSIKERGLKHPGLLLPDGTLLDGRNRRMACEAAGVEMRWEVCYGDPLDAVIDENVERRQLNVGQRASLAEKSLPFFEARAKARQVAATVLGNVTRHLPVEADLPQLENDTPTTPAPKKQRAPQARDEAAAKFKVSGRAVAQAKRVMEKAPELMAQVDAGTLAIDAADKEVRTLVAKESYLKRQATWDRAANSKGKQWEIMHGDFREMLASLDDGSVDAIITDPPYPDQFLPLWADLAEHALRVLRPGAPLIAWSGQYRLREVLNHLCGPLRYQWTLCLDLPGSNARFRGPNMIQTWKPIIVCTAGQWGPHEWNKDRVTSPGKDQELYEWQQNPDPAAELIRRYVPEGGLVLDPFTGVGSFGVAALATGRRFVGVELNDERHLEACQRLAGAVGEVAA